VLNPFYFDRSICGGSGLDRVIDSETISFARFCAKEWSLENYIAYLSISAFRKSPSWLRLQVFYVAFLKGDASPLDINIPKSHALPIAQQVNAQPVFRRNILGRDVAKGPARDTLDDVLKDVRDNLADTYSRYPFVGTGRSDRANQLRGQTTDDKGVIDGLGILESGGMPVRHMHLTGVVQGF